MNSTFSFGFAFGYDLNPRLNIELQYIFTEFEDTYNYGYYGGYGYDAKFDQNDLAVILNYKVLPAGPVRLLLRGGLNYSYRSVRDSYWGDTDSSTSILALIGLGAEVKIIPNLYVTGVLDYNLNLDNSGLSYDPSPLDLVSGENYTNFNVGLKYKF
ncbi:MAG: porin family protein [Bdellovibrionaceae bacterium]|nr:porin family protein [Pseudobdellovibrionaceae bacterium]